MDSFVVTLLSSDLGIFGAVGLSLLAGVALRASAGSLADRLGAHAGRREEG